MKHALFSTIAQSNYESDTRINGARNLKKEFRQYQIKDKFSGTNHDDNEAYGITA